MQQDLSTISGIKYAVEVHYAEGVKAEPAYLATAVEVTDRHVQATYLAISDDEMSTMRTWDWPEVSHVTITKI